MGIHEAERGSVVEGSEDGGTLGEAGTKPSPWMPGHRGQSVWPIRVGPELAMAVDGQPYLITVNNLTQCSIRRMDLQPRLAFGSTQTVDIDKA